MMASETKKWLPLESNPDVLSKYCWELGMPATLSFEDVLSFESWALEMVPRPVLALVFLYPVTPESDQRDRTEEANQSNTGNTYFMRQTVPNACGTVACLHVLANLESIGVGNSNYIERFVAATKAMTPDERASFLASDKEIETKHSSVEDSGQSRASADPDVDTHFVAFLVRDGKVVELDGRKKFPYLYDVTGGDDLEEMVKVVKRRYVDSNPDEIRFSMMALVETPKD